MNYRWNTIQETCTYVNLTRRTWRGESAGRHAGRQVGTGRSFHALPYAICQVSALPFLNLINILRPLRDNNRSDQTTCSRLIQRHDPMVQHPQTDTGFQTVQQRLVLLFPQRVDNI